MAFFPPQLSKLIFLSTSASVLPHMSKKLKGPCSPFFLSAFADYFAPSSQITVMNGGGKKHVVVKVGRCVVINRPN